jgi:hydroxymethylpyrimidine pyrophosphatase-like HAD family hydrolase
MDHLCEFIDTEIAAIKSQLLAYERNSIYLRFAHAQYNKGSALTELREQLGIPAERTFAIGDNHNDLTMLTGGAAGMVACPANTVADVAAAVKGAGGYIAKRPAGAGVAEAIAHFFA